MIRLGSAIRGDLHEQDTADDTLPDRVINLSSTRWMVIHAPPTGARPSSPLADRMAAFPEIRRVNVNDFSSVRGSNG